MSGNTTGSNGFSAGPYLQFKLQNPFLNSIFSVNDPLKSPLKDVYQQLSRSPFSYGFLVPDTNILANYVEQVSGTSYRELCFRPDFLRDHILDLRDQNYPLGENSVGLIVNSKKGQTYKTLSGRVVQLKKDVLLHDGSKFHVTGVELFVNFNQFFPRLSEFLVIGINSPLVGRPIHEIDFRKLSQPTPRLQGHSRAGSTVSLDLVPPLLLPRETAVSLLTFHEIQGRFPLVQQQIGEDFQHLFRNFVIENVEDVHEIRTLFRETINQSALVFKLLDETIISSIIDYAPWIDLNHCIYDYVELNLFDRVWHQLLRVLQKVVLDEAAYDKLRHISITQVGLVDKVSRDGRKDRLLMLALLPRVAAAVNVFSQMEIANSYATKTKVLIDTLQIMSAPISLWGGRTEETSADMLVALMLLVVIQLRVTKLLVHIEYIKQFLYSQTDSGFVGYAVSTVEAVMFHLQNHNNLTDLETRSAQNKELEALLVAKDLTHLRRFLESVAPCDDAFLPVDHCLKSLTIEGESCLMLAIKHSSYEIFKTLLDYEYFFPVEDIIYDVNLRNATLLSVALVLERSSMVDDLVSIVISSCTTVEKIEYFLARDYFGRNIGHYLFLQEDLVGKIGMFIDWRDKDTNGHSPLVSLCRKYDIENYYELMAKVFQVIDLWYECQGMKFDYADHIDSKNNSVLHILKGHLDQVLNHEFVNVNHYNFKGFSPLILAIKYNRLDNVKSILADLRLNLGKVDPRNFMTVFDFVKPNGNTEVEKLVDGKFLKTVPSVDGKKVGILRAKFENSQWHFLIKGLITKQMPDNKLKIHHYTNYHSLTDFKDLIRLLHIEYPMTYLPVLALIDYINKLNVSGFSALSFSKLKVDLLIDKLNAFMASLLLSNAFNSHELVWEFLILPQINSDKSEDRSRLKAESYREKLFITDSPISESPNIPEEFTDTGSENLEELFFLDQNKNYLQEDMDEVLVFMKYSLEELVKTQKVFKKLTQLLVVGSHKHADLYESYKVFLQVILEKSTFKLPYFELLSLILSKSVEENFHPRKKLVGLLQYLESCLDRLIRNIQSVIDKKIMKWNKLTFELKNLRLEIIRLKPEDFGAGADSDVSPLLDEGEADSDVFGPAKKRNFLSNLIESRKSNYETKVIKQYKTSRLKLMGLSNEVKFSHESLATEINNFLEFKELFLKYSLKVFVKNELGNLKYLKMMYRRGAQTVR